MDFSSTSWLPLSQWLGLQWLSPHLLVFSTDGTVLRPCSCFLIHWPSQVLLLHEFMYYPAPDLGEERVAKTGHRGSKSFLFLVHCGRGRNFGRLWTRWVNPLHKGSLGVTLPFSTRDIAGCDGVSGLTSFVPLSLIIYIFNRIWIWCTWKTHYLHVYLCLFSLSSVYFCLSGSCCLCCSSLWCFTSFL